MKDDLISRSALIEVLKNPLTFETQLEVTIDDLITIVENQPTAYDVDKVVAELENANIDGFVYIDKAIKCVRNGGKE